MTTRSADLGSRTSRCSPRRAVGTASGATTTGRACRRRSRRATAVDHRSLPLEAATSASPSGPSVDWRAPSSSRHHTAIARRNLCRPRNHRCQRSRRTLLPRARRRYSPRVTTWPEHGPRADLRRTQRLRSRRTRGTSSSTMGCRSSSLPASPSSRCAEERPRSRWRRVFVFGLPALFVIAEGALLVSELVP